MMSLSVSQSQLVFPEESDTGGWWGRGSLSPERGEKNHGNGFCVVGGGEKRRFVAVCIHVV